MKCEGDIDRKIRCKRCGGEFTVRDLILSAYACYRSLRVVRSRTPCCQSNEELWLRDGIASRGYVYAAGQAHFADMDAYRAPGLEVDYTPDRVLIRLGDCEKEIGRT